MSANPAGSKLGSSDLPVQKTDYPHAGVFGIAFEGFEEGEAKMREVHCMIQVQLRCSSSLNDFKSIEEVECP